MADIESGLIAGRPNRYVQLATAAVPDGPEVVDKWHRLGMAQADRLGVEGVTVAVASREDADNPELAGLIRGAGLIYLSGGHPAFLADTLRGTAVWSAIETEWRSGAALAGCSAGAMALTAWIPSIRSPRQGSTPGLGLLPHLRVIPHFDAFAARIPDVVTRFVLPHDPAVTVLGVDEDTAVVGGPHDWTVLGRQSAWRLSKDKRERIPSGATFTTRG
jgi:cyanophycinase-like exopeptidase